MADSFREVYGLDLHERELPRVLSFGSWIGGDRDGNPFVTAECTRDALQMARNVIIDHYVRQTSKAIDLLSSSMRQVGHIERAAPATEGVRSAPVIRPRHEGFLKPSCIACS